MKAAGIETQRNVKIKGVDYSKEIPFENVKEAMVALNQYVESPYLKQQEWRKILE